MPTDEEFMRELLQLYLHSSQHIIKDMRAASCDLADLCRQAHKLKGASAGIHARRVASLCETLEKSAAQATAQELARQLEQLEDTLANLHDQLRQYIEQRHRLVHRQIDAGVRVGSDGQVQTGIELETQEYTPDLIEAVARYDAQVIPCLVRGTRRERDFQVPRRAFGRDSGRAEADLPAPRVRARG